MPIEDEFKLGKIFYPSPICQETMFYDTLDTSYINRGA
jgi:hypothetical protein